MDTIDAVRQAHRRHCRSATAPRRCRMRPARASSSSPMFSEVVRRSSELTGAMRRSHERSHEQSAITLTPDDIRSLVRPDHVHRRAYADAGGVRARAGAHLRPALDLRRARKPAQEARRLRPHPPRLARGAGHPPHRRRDLRAAKPLSASRRAALHGRSRHQPAVQLPLSCLGVPAGRLARLGAAPQELSGRISASTIRRTTCSGSSTSQATAASCSPR